MSHELDGKRIAFLVAQTGVESVELTVPWAAVRNAGGRPFLVSTGLGPIQGTNLGALTGDTFKVDNLTAQLAARDCNALVLPGGVTNAELLRDSSDAVRLVSEMVAAGRPIAAISHGVGILLEAGVLAGKVITGWDGLEQEAVLAGARWSGEDVQFCPDHGWMLVTGRTPAALPEFSTALVTGFI